MAFRTFREESTFKDPNINPLPFTAAIAQQAMRMRHQDRVNRENAARDEATRRANLSDRFKYDAGAGNYGIDNKYLGEITQKVVSTAREDIRTTGQVSNAVKRFEVEGKVIKADSDAQYKLARNLDGTVRANNDPYYDRQSDMNKIRIAEYGIDGKVDFRTRGERLEGLELNTADSFMFDKYINDYIGDLDKDQIKRSTVSPTGVTSGSTIKGQFLDAKGNAQVTDTDAVKFLSSREEVSDYYDNIMMEELSVEIDQMRASNDPNQAWMEGMEDEEVAQRIAQDPSLNSINKTPYGTRKRKLAQKDLMARQEINRNVDYKYDPSKKVKSGGVTNNNIGHEYSFGSSMMNAQSPDGQTTPNFNSGPGGVLSTRTGTPVKLMTNSPDRLNINSGKMSRNAIGHQNFNLTSYKLQTFTKDGRPVANNSQTQEDAMEWISALPDSAFDPNGAKALAPQMMIAFEGYTLDRTNVINSLNKREGDISKQIDKAQKAGNEDKVAELQGLQESIDQIKTVMTQDVDDQELIDLVLRKGVGIQSIQENQVFLASENDMSKLKSVTGGLDLKDQSKWSPEMKEIYNLYIDRYKQAKENNFGNVPTGPEPGGTSLNATEYLKKKN